MNELIIWNYSKSVEWMKPRINRWVNIWDEIEPELRKARDELSSHYYRDGTNVPTWADYCEDIGISKRHANRLLNKDEALVSKFTGNIENYTPNYIMKSVREVLDNIDLDPASCELAQNIVKAKEYYTEQSDGLNHEWYGNVYLNPPYKYPLIEHFINKLILELPNI